ncbi:MAG TPA: DUF692 domain-containing protein [Usitatibacter sp.]|nr:DUF692 domain-containing protein [Usitatibacter sp.]
MVGIGLRAPHYAPLAHSRPPLGFLEVHSENYFAAGGPALAWLERFRRDYELSLHGVGLSLGSSDPLDERHLAKLAALVERTQPMLVSEHLCWSSIGGRHANDLLPLPFTEEAIGHVVARVQRVQERLARAILVENVSSYHAFAESTLPEERFVAEVVRRAGCRLLLDVNNVYVNARNHGFDPSAYLEALDPASVGEIHLGGHTQCDGMLVDTHGAPVCEAVWSLYEEALRRFGRQPTLVEWDTDIPALDVLLGEAERARAMQMVPAHQAMEATA